MCIRDRCGGNDVAFAAIESSQYKRKRTAMPSWLTDPARRITVSRLTSLGDASFYGRSVNTRDADIYSSDLRRRWVLRLLMLSIRTFSPRFPVSRFQSSRKWRGEERRRRKGRGKEGDGQRLGDTPCWKWWKILCVHRFDVWSSCLLCCWTDGL